MKTEAAIEINKVTKTFGPKRALDNVSLTIPQGQIFGFLGPNGAGKTTMIRCLMDFIRPTSGSVRILGKDSHSASTEIKSQLGFISSDNQLYANWTPTEHINFAGAVRKDSQAEAKKLMTELGLDADRKFKHLSSGNKQKLGLILALMSQPKLLIMDEPTRGLDPLLQNQIYEILKQFRADGGTVFMSSHNLAEVEGICDSVGIIKSGRLIKTESMAKLRQMKTHMVTAVTSVAIKPADFKMPHVSVESITDDRVVLKVRGDINPVIAALAKYQLKDLLVAHASLEDVFLEFYR